MASCVPAPACVAVRRQASRLWPDRSQASDGICASPTHTAASPSSDHEPHVVYNGIAYATAVDLTDDKTAGCDADTWAEWLRTSRDVRVKYVIANRRMFSSYPTSSCPAWTWRPYTGANPHDKHTHLSVLPEALFDDEPWFPQLATPKPAEVDDMPMSCVVPWVARRPNGRVPFLEVIAVPGANEAIVVSYNDAPFTPPWNDKTDGDDVLFSFWSRRLKGLTGPPVGIDIAPDGKSIVVACRGGGTYDVAKKP